jgi:DNA mismatch endonuclease (patch repair protein)
MSSVRTGTSFASTAAVRSKMQAQARRDTDCEMRIRRALHALGLRYRVHRRALPDLRREVDVVFRPARVAVFVDGCFWHGCRRHRQPVKANAPWWRDKILRNRVRDRDTNQRLLAAGWCVVRIWEHVDAGRAALTVARVVRRLQRSPELLVLD